jgi:hypothetical protein
MVGVSLSMKFREVEGETEVALKASAAAIGLTPRPSDRPCAPSEKKKLIVK